MKVYELLDVLSEMDENVEVLISTDGVNQVRIGDIEETVNKYNDDVIVISK